jgi:CRP/FNR family cyclic AMP-dependent transcriptional regulator
MSVNAVHQALHEVALFRDLSDDDLSVLARQVVRRHYDRNEMIFSQTDSGDGLYVVTRGHVAISRLNPDGDELILAVYEPGEYLGELALFDEEPRSAGAVAIEDCDVLFLSRSAFRSFITTHPKAIVTCLEVIVGQLRRCTDLVDEIALLDVRSRLARRLLRLAKQGMVETGSSEPIVGSFRITQQQLANMMGATRESVNKHLNGFVDRGILRLERGNIHILDLKRLEDASIGLP